MAARRRGMLTHAAFARASTVNAPGTLTDEGQSFGLVAKAPLTFDC